MENNTDSNESLSISLFDILELLEDKYWEFWNINHNFENNIYYNWDMYSFMGINPFWSEFDYNENKLVITLHSEKLCFKKYESNVIACNNSYSENKLISESSNIISKFIDVCLAYSDFNTQNSNNIKSTNSDYLVNIKNKGIDVILEGEKLEIQYRTYRDNTKKYKIYCESSDKVDIFRGKENELFKKIFVRIDECPEWIQDKLYEIRHKQLEKEKHKIFIKSLFKKIKKSTKK